MRRSHLFVGIGTGMACVLLCGSLVGAQEKPARVKPTLVEPGPRTRTIQYSDRVANELETQTVWKPFCIDQSNEITVEDLRNIARISRAAAEANPPPEEAPNVAGVIAPRFNLEFNATTAMPAGAVPALEEVEYYFESQFTDPISITINIAFGNLGPGILGGTSSNYLNVTWPNTRDGLINGMDADDSIQLFIPPGSTIPVRYDGNSATVTNENRTFVTFANYRATIGSVSGAVASMTFNNAFAWDYDPPVFEVPGTYDFQSVIVHEVGHALGFVSGADFRSNDMEMLDVYRFQRSDGLGDFNPDDFAEFTTTARLVDQNAPGTNDDSNSDLVTVEYQMSDGNPNQASHFHEQSPSIGIMDPTFASGQTFYPNFLRTPDLNMFDAMGWDFPHLNQSCPNATEMACNSTVHFDNLPVTGTVAPPFSCGIGTSHVAAVWWKFTATHDSARISTCDSLAADPTFAVYESDCGSLVEIACGESGGCANSNKASVCVKGLTPGNTYYIQVAARNLSSRGIVELDLECSCDGACCLPPPALCLIADEDQCATLGGLFSGGETACGGDEDLDGRDETCQSAVSAVSQVPTDNQEDLPSNIDAGDSVPNSVLAEGFVSDGRGVRSVRWWGSVLDPSVTPDGWFVGFHEPLTAGGAQSPALAFYFCGSEVVTSANMDFDSCDAEAVVQYTAALVDCCLLDSNSDSRTLGVPGTPGGFLAESCMEYALSIQAVAGRRYDADGFGVCQGTVTATAAAGDFWGWHSTTDDHVAGLALASTVTEVSGDWLFEAWSGAVSSCGNADTSFELLTSDLLGVTPSIIWGNGTPDNSDALNSQFGGARVDWITVDDVDFPDGAVINDFHFVNEEQNTFAWDNKVRLEIYPDNAGAPDESGGPTLAIWVPADVGAVQRTSLGAGNFFPRYRYDITGLNIPLAAGRWWIGVASAGVPGSTGFSYWLTSHKQGVSQVFFGSEAYTKAPANGIPTFVPWSSGTGGQFYDMSFDVTSSAIVDCNCNGTPDDQDAILGPDCNSNGVPDECESDCNASGVPDDCDVAKATSEDCNENGLPDECDVSYGTSVDANGDNVPDECCEVIVTPIRDPSDPDKCRFVTLPPPPTGMRAVRVRLNSLHHPSPPYTGDTAQDFSAFEGQVRWLGPPVQYIESTSSGIPFMMSTLQCDPYYTDWSTVGIVHVTGNEVVPSSVYDVQWITVGCQEGSESSFSSPLTIATTRWGDVEEPFNPPSPTVQPDVSDISALVNKFKSAPGAPIKARALLSGNVPDPTFDLSFAHISDCVDAFRGQGFPYLGPVNCP